MEAKESLNGDSAIIALVGAGCVGKTTLLEHLRAELAGDDRVALVDEAAKRYFAVHEVPDDQRFTVGTQGEIQQIALAAERSACAQAELVVVDRSALDYAVYVGAIGDPDGEALLLSRVRPWVAKMYRHIFLLDPGGIPFVNTAERRENEEMREHLHDAFLRFFSRHNIEFVLLKGPVEGRRDKLRGAIRSALNKK